MGFWWHFESKWVAKISKCSKCAYLILQISKIYSTGKNKVSLSFILKISKRSPDKTFERMTDKPHPSPF